MVLTKVQCFKIFKHFLTCYNAHILFIFCPLIFAIKGSTILSNWFPYSSGLLISIRLKLLCLNNLFTSKTYSIIQTCMLLHNSLKNFITMIALKNTSTHLTCNY